jgi:hypothetical protein
LAPVISPHGSDSAKMDNALDLLVESGRDIRHAMMMLVPKAWEKPSDVTPQQRAFYRYHSCLQEPWDGPAALSFTDGVVAGSMLDRNGLRPARFTVMDDGLVIMSSEVGAVEVDERRVVQKGRLRPGEMLAVDTSTGLVENDTAIVARFVERQPYGKWLDENMVTMEDVRRRVWQMADGRWQMANGKWQMADGRWQMADGRWQAMPCKGRKAISHWPLAISHRPIRNRESKIHNHFRPRSGTPARSCSWCCARCGRKAVSRSARWEMTRPRRRSLTSRGRCSTISSSVSPR